MQLLDSHIEAGQELPPKEKQAYYTALIEYVYYGIEPDLTGAAKAVFIAIKPTLDNSRARSEAGRNGGKRKSKTEANAKQTVKQNGSKAPSKTEANAKQTVKQNGSKAPSKTEANENQNTDFSGSYQDSPSPSYSPYGEGVQGEGFDPPTLDEARTYFAANCLKGDPELFWATYEAKGWLDGGGRPITSWTAQALKWSRMQVARDAERNGGELPAPPPKPVNAPDEGDLEADERAFFERYGYWPGEGEGS